MGGLYFFDCILNVRTEEWFEFCRAGNIPLVVEVGLCDSVGVGIVLGLVNKCCLEVGEKRLDLESERSVWFKICGGLQLTGS